MKAWLPYPLISVLLLAIWLLLNQSLALAHILLGGA
ncbi:MAG TPA: Na+/H+ antiporter subunit E, partial [Hyphomicrobiaceae bacterium]